MKAYCRSLAKTMPDPAITGLRRHAVNSHEIVSSRAITLLLQRAVVCPYYLNGTAAVVSLPSSRSQIPYGEMRKDKCNMRRATYKYHVTDKS